jgi:hypothetical protein
MVHRRLDRAMVLIASADVVGVPLWLNAGGDDTR